MSANRNEDLQRKLASMPAPAPPPGLAEKIKADIPATLNVNRVTRSPMLFTLRVAASILIVAIGAYAMLRVFSRPSPIAPPPSAATPPATAALQKEAPALQTAPAPVAQVAEAKERQAPPARHHREPAAKIARAEPEPLESEAAPPPPAAAAPAAVGGAIAMKTANAVQESARAADLAVARPEVEATVSPYSGRMILLVTAPDAVVEGAEKLAPNLYATDKQSVTVRLHEVERTVRRADARPWDAASETIKQAVTKAERPSE